MYLICSSCNFLKLIIIISILEEKTLRLDEIRKVDYHVTKQIQDTDSKFHFSHEGGLWGGDGDRGWVPSLRTKLGLVQERS